MPRVTGSFIGVEVGGERVRAFMPEPLPPSEPPLCIEGALAELHDAAASALGRLDVAAGMVPSAGWFLYGFVRKEAVVSSQIEGTQATLMDVLTYEATHEAAEPAEVEEVCNYVEALDFARAELADPDGMGIGTELLCEAHARLMRGARGGDKEPGRVRTEQNWLGGATPGLAVYVPPPPDAVPSVLAELEEWLRGDDPLPPLVRAGLAHAQFETIHPFLDGNGRIGRLLVTLLVEHWGLLSSPLLYLSLAFRRHQREYYDRLMRVRTDGDWEGWTGFFLACVREAAEDGVDAAERLFGLLEEDRRAVVHDPAATVSAIRLFDALPEHPIVTLNSAAQTIEVSKPTAAKAIDILRDVGVLEEITGRQRDRIYAYRAYLDVLAEDTEPTGPPPGRGDGLRRSDERLRSALRRLDEDTE
ncbi:MAG: Fic/DOC family N-terminal domain-containing protein [Candidatus Brocadiia bacterium]